MNEANALPPRSPRIAAIDILRGVALIAMAVFHGGWDVAYNHLFRFDPGASPGWILLARLTAGTFLILVGIGLVLSTRNGFRPRPFARRLAMIVLAALLVSVATYFVMPDGWIFFGILHEIALASLLGLAFVGLPAWISALVAIVVFALPHLFVSEIFSHPALWWVGLAPVPPESFDYVPLFPWFGDVLVGIAIARFAVDRGYDRLLAAWQPTALPFRWLEFGGRHSLAFYLIHQPVLFGLAYAAAAMFMPNAAEDSARADCVDRCALDNPRAGCVNYCACVFDDLKVSGLLAPLLQNRLSSEQNGQLRQTAGLCTAKTLPATDTGTVQ